MRRHDGYRHRHGLLGFAVLDWCSSDHRHVSSLSQIHLCRRKSVDHQYTMMEVIERFGLESGL
jgi:hypothetical protein